jgi:PIN domain nuclease of toxin-antitoxin system
MFCYGGSREVQNSACARRRLYFPLTIHSDPFDRMLVAQAQCEGLTLVTADPAITAYEIRTIDASN